MSRSESWSRAGGPWSAAAGWIIGIEALAAQLWLYAYSFPAAALIPQLAAAVATIGLVVAVIGWAIAVTRPVDLHGDARVVGGSVVRVSTVAIVVALATVGLCAGRAPDVDPTRRGHAADALVGPPGSTAVSQWWTCASLGGHLPLSNVYRSDSGYTEFESNISGILQSASYIYSPGGDPESLDRRSGLSADDGVHYRHLLGPWWAATSDAPGT